MALAGKLMLATFRPGFYRGFKRAIKKSKTLQVELRKLRRPLSEDLKGHAAREASPEGSWPRRSQGSEARASKRRAKVVRGRGRKAGKRLGARSAVRFVGGSQLLGQLPDTVVARVRRGSLIAKSPVPWSGAHNDPKGTRVGRGVFLPGRPFVFLSPKFLDLATERLADHVIGDWGRR